MVASWDLNSRPVNRKSVITCVLMKRFHRILNLCNFLFTTYKPLMSRLCVASWLRFFDLTMAKHVVLHTGSISAKVELSTIFHCSAGGRHGQTGGMFRNRTSEKLTGQHPESANLRLRLTSVKESCGCSACTSVTLAVPKPRPCFPHHMWGDHGPDWYRLACSDIAGQASKQAVNVTMWQTMWRTFQF